MTPIPYQTTADERARALAVVDLVWQTNADLAKRAGLSKRRFRAAITDLVVYDRRPILSGEQGYRLTYDAAELRASRERLARLGINILRHARALGRIAAALDQYALPKEAA